LAKASAGKRWPAGAAAAPCSGHGCLQIHRSNQIGYRLVKLVSPTSNRCLLQTMTRTLSLLAALLISPLLAAAPGLPGDLDVDESLPTPAEVLGFEPGERHPRHDQIVAYLEALAESSDRVRLEEIGRSHGRRPQILLTFASPERLAEIDDIRAGRRQAAREGEGPPVVWLGYSVHGNEASGASAALVMAWYLAAGQDER